MKEGVFGFVLVFLVIGIYLNASFVFAEEGNNGSNSGGDNGNGSITNNSESSDDEEDEENEVEIESEDDEENETNDDSRKNKSKVKEKVVRREGNCTIKIERELEIENGKRVESIKRKIECRDGTKEEIKIKVENRTEEGKFREKIKYEIKGREIEVETEEGIDLQEESNETHYRLKARLRNGNITNIEIMPDEASEIALERLKALNFTVELRESIHKNIPRVVYNIETNKHGRFLGVFKLAVKVEGQVDPETGEFIGIIKPWWAFLVAGEDDDETEVSGIGIVQFVDAEGGCWRIFANNETNYEPTNLNDTFKQNGLKVEFEGKIQENATSICQVGTIIELTEIEIVGNETD